MKDELAPTRKTTSGRLRDDGPRSSLNWRIAEYGSEDQRCNARGEGPRSFQALLCRGPWVETGARGQGDHLLQTGGIVFALFLRDRLAEDFQADPATFGRAALALAHNVRAKEEVDPLIKRLRLRAPQF
jgi:hypothetical protein